MESSASGKGVKVYGCGFCTLGFKAEGFRI